MRYQNSDYRRSTRRSKSSTSIEDLEASLDRLITQLVDHRQRRWRKNPSVKIVGFTLSELAKVPLEAPGHQTKDRSFDGRIKSLMTEVGQQLAKQLTQDDLHRLIERVADVDPQNWGARFTPICSAFNGIRTTDNAIWIT